MELTAKERLTKFYREIGLSKNAFEKAINVSHGYMDKLRDCPSRDKLEIIYRTFPELNRVWLLTGEGNMLNKEDKELPRISMISGVPYYNVDFTLGFDLLENDQTRTPDCLIDFPMYNQCTCWVNAHGDSMHPTISSGDMVALKKLDDFRYLISGEIYAIVTKNGLRTIKRVNDRGDNILLVPDNKKYTEQTIPKKELMAVFSVKACVKAY